MTDLTQEELCDLANDDYRVSRRRLTDRELCVAFGMSLSWGTSLLGEQTFAEACEEYTATCDGESNFPNPYASAACDGGELVVDAVCEATIETYVACVNMLGDYLQGLSELTCDASTDDPAFDLDVGCADVVLDCQPHPPE
ncbi:MAG: hypothetical protein KC656_29135 [Myxococcales bacterium]|nr:hypothetical protein [Myxococcales bacterium]MCB9669875.1 hypothetical protein [Alphaproteobacteria bacterium]MCB9693251.1 hypothetical protein [Alphaproteobacteria bacterium]